MEADRRLRSLALLILLCTVAFVLSCASGDEAGGELLREGASRERALSEGEEHLYELLLPPGQAAVVVANKQGIDLSLQLRSSTGQLEVGLERPSLYYGEERMTVLADPGSPRRRLAVKATSDPKRNGRYTLRIARIAPATPRDEAQARAERAFSVAYNGDAPPTARARIERAEQFGKALDRLEEAGDWELAHFAASHAMREFHFAGDFERALALNARAIEMATRGRQFRHRALARISRGNTLFMLDRRGEASAAWQLAEEEATLLGIEPLAIEARLLRTWNLMYPVDPTAAFEELDELWRQDFPKIGGDQLVRLLTIVADARLEYGDLEGATRAIAEADARAAQAEEDTLTRLDLVRGRVALQEREWENARLAFQKMRDRSRSRDDAALEGTAVIALAQVETRSGSPAQAEELLVEALELSRRRNLLQVEFLASTNLAWVRVESASPKMALAPANRALQIASAVGGTWLARALFTKARVMLDLDQLDEANQLMKQCLAWIDGVQARIEAPSLRGLFSAHNQDYYELAAEIRHQLARRQRQTHYDQEAFQLIERSRARAFLGYLNRARVDVFKEVSPDLRRRSDELEHRLEVAQGRWLEVRDTKNGAESIARVELEEVYAEQERLKIALVEGSGRFRTTAHLEAISVEQLQSLLDERTQLVAFSVAEPRSLAWIIGRDSFETIELPGRALLEEPVASLRSSLAEGDRRRVQPEVRENLRTVSEALFTEIVPRLRAERLIIIPDEGLHAVPFAAFSDPSSPTFVSEAPLALIDRFEIVQLPSATVYAELLHRNRSIEGWPRSAAILGDPVYRPDDDRLPVPSPPSRQQATNDPLSLIEQIRRDTRRDAPARLYFASDEVAALRRRLPAERRIEKLGSDATREALLSETLLGQDLLHIIAHGLADDDRSEVSGLELSRFDRAGSAIESAVGPGDLYGATIKADLVVLSACRSGLGREIQGEGLVGISRGFQHAGARRVLVSLWDIRDSSTATLMDHFYEGLLEQRLSPAAALRAAQLRLRADPRYREPYSWAGFILQGDH